MASGSTKFHVLLSFPYHPSQQFDLDDAITMPAENPTIPDLTQQFDLDDAITMPENTQATQQAILGLVSDMPEVDHAAGSCSVCMESLGKSEETARQVSCGHVYHHSCIIGWLLNGKSNSCPLCRREISG